MSAPVIIAQESIDKLAHALASAMRSNGGEAPAAPEAPAAKAKKSGKDLDLVALSGIASLLVPAASAHGRTVKEDESVEACTKALSAIQEKLSKEEKGALEQFIKMPNFKVFAGAWQKWHDQTSKEVFGR